MTIPSDLPGKISETPQFQSPSPTDSTELDSSNRVQPIGPSTIHTTQNSESPDSPSFRAIKIEGIDLSSSTVDDIEHEVEELTKLDKIIGENPDQAKRAQELVDKHGDEFIYEILEKSESLEPFILEEGLFRNMAALEIGVVSTNILSRGGVLILTGMLLNKMKEVIAAKEDAIKIATGEEKNSLENEVKILKKSLFSQTALFRQQMKSSLLTSTFSLPKLGGAIARLVGPAALTAGEVIGGVGLGFGLIRSAMQVRDTSRNIKEHDAWTKTIQNRENVQVILDKQKGIYEKRLFVFKEVLEPIQQLQDPLEIPAALEKLKKAGIVLPLENPTLDQLKEFASNPEKVARHQEAVVVSCQNGVRAFVEKKQKIDKGFLEFRFNKAKTLFTTTSIATAITITLKVLAIGGVALAATGFGVLGLSLGFMVVGAVYLYVKKPNIFKTYLQGVQAKLILTKIPLKIQKFRLQYTLYESQRVSDTVKSLANPKQQSRQEALRNKMTKLKSSIDRLEKKVQVLQDKIDEAGWKDFQRKVFGKEEKLTLIFAKKSKEGEIVLDEKGKPVFPKKNWMLLDELTESLANDPTLFDNKETKELLEHMDINQNTLKKPSADSTKQMSQMLRTFFAMDEEATIQMIAKQKLTGLSEQNESTA